MRKLTKDSPHYISLIGLVTCGLLGFFLFSYDPFFQSVIAVSICLAYFTWGVVHHILHRDFHLSVLLEYFVFSTLGLVLLLTLIFHL